jgi:predicted glycoside hydrolase/deacetylase ChbG (UPF0249 family)
MLETIPYIPDTEVIENNGHAQKGRLLLVSDDVFVTEHGPENGNATRQAIASLKEVGDVYPELCLSLLITDRESVSKYRRELVDSGLDLGLHIDLVEGTPFTKDEQGLFGSEGLLTRRLGVIESPRLQSLPRELQWKPGWEDSIRREMASQVAEFEWQFGKLPAHISYHYGLHNDRDTYRVYLDFASDLANTEGVPFRHALSHLDVPRAGSPLHADFFADHINHPRPQPFSTADVLTVAQSIPAGKSAELCLHLGKPERWYQQQTEVLKDRSLRPKLEQHATIVRASDLARQPQQRVIYARN